MRVIIAGTRSISSPEEVSLAIRQSGFPVTEIVSGGCGGVDRVGEAWATTNRIPTKVFYAEWQIYGRAAGPIRNAKMAEYADALVAVWDGESRGTRSMIDLAGKSGIPVYIKIVKGG
jgi:hypothetical protein